MVKLTSLHRFIWSLQTNAIEQLFNGLGSDVWQAAKWDINTQLYHETNGMRRFEHDR